MALKAKRSVSGTDSMLNKKKSRSSLGGVERTAESSEDRKPKLEPRAAPNFLSALKNEEVDFPRGGGSVLTPLEVRQSQLEGRREAESEASKRPLDGKQRKRRQQLQDRDSKRQKKSTAIAEAKERDKDSIRVEQLNSKRLIPGTRVLTRIHSILPLHLILSLPNNLLAHVSITEISKTFTSLLEAEEAMSTSEDGDDAESSTSSHTAPDLTSIFTPGQYFPAKVLNTYPTASQSFISQYPVSETTRLAAKTELTLVPEKVNLDMSRKDWSEGYQLVGEVLSEEDKGWRIGLGEFDDVQAEGWISRKEVDSYFAGSPLIVGQLVRCAISGKAAGSRITQLSLDPDLLRKSQTNEVSTVESLLPGQLVSALVTAVVPSGLNVKISGFYDGTIELSHSDLGDEDIEEKYKVGKKIRARIIYETLTSTPRHFSLSLLPHILSFSSPLVPNKDISIEQDIAIGKVLNSVEITRVIPEWGVMCRTSDGIDGFVHISHISDGRIPALSGNTGQFKVGTLHRARVIGHSPMDGVLLLSFEQKVLDQAFMQVDELKVGQVLKGTIHRLTDKGMFVNINGSVDGAVWPIHYADIRLKHPEKRFKVGSSVRARIFALEPARGRVVLTLKKSLVDSELKTPSGFEDVQLGDITPAVVTKILDKGCLVDLFGGLRAFIPQSEASQQYVTNLADIFYIGKPVTVRITEVQQESQRLVASVRQALPTALAAEKIEIGDIISGTVSQVHPEQVLLTLQPSQLSALLSLSNLSNHRAVGIEELRNSLKTGDHLEDLVVVSKNANTGLLIVANKRLPQKAETLSSFSGVSRPARAIDSLKAGQLVTGQVIAVRSQGIMVQLPQSLQGRIHPCDIADDFSHVAGKDEPFSMDQEIECYILKVNKGSKQIDLSTRPSRVDPSTAGEVEDPEITDLSALKEGQKIRGLVKNVTNGGLFVALGRDVTARVMIKELFDEFVKDWQSQFSINQLVSGKILSVDTKRKLVEMTLRQNPSSKGAKKAATKSLSDFEVGQIITASVKKLETYGIFLRIEDSDISGLCHRSEISDTKGQDVSKALRGFREGDQLKAAIIEIDKAKGRVNFSIKPSRFADGQTVEQDDDEEMLEEDAEEEDEDEDEDEEEEEQLEGMSEDEAHTGSKTTIRLMDAGDSDDEELAEDEEDDEDGDEEEDEDDEDEDEALLNGLAEDDSDEGDDSESIPATKPNSRSNANGVAATSLSLPGFKWTGEDGESEAESSGSSSEDEEEIAASSTLKSTSRKGKQKATHDLSSTAQNDKPESVSDFERALLASPNSSFLWIQFMSFQLQLHEIEKARKIGRQALQKINFREEAEKLNVWMALINLELGFGTPDSTDKVFKEAIQYNDAKSVYMRYVDALVESGKNEVAEEVMKKMVKKFSQHLECWIRFAEWYFKNEKVDDAREILSRSMKSLDKSKHIEVIEKFAILEFKHADAERGKTLFEELVDRCPKRLDLWSVYIDQLSKTGDIQGVRGLFDRALNQKLTSKKAKFLFKKWLAIENRIGDVAGQDNAKERAKAWVLENTKPDSDDEE